MKDAYRNQNSNDKIEVSKYLKTTKNYRKELRVSSVKLRLDRANIYKEKGLVFEALREYEDILQQDPDNKEVQENIAKLGKARLAEGQTDLGLETMVMPRKKGMPKPVVFSLLFGLIDDPAGGLPGLHETAPAFVFSLFLCFL